jgi:hypothetical protein
VEHNKIVKWFGTLGLGVHLKLFHRHLDSEISPAPPIITDLPNNWITKNLPTEWAEQLKTRDVQILSIITYGAGGKSAHIEYLADLAPELLMGWRAEAAAQGITFNEWFSNVLKESLNISVEFSKGE